VIDNSGPLPDLQAQVDRVIGKLDGRAGWSWVLSWLIPPVGIARALLRIGWRLYFKEVGKPKKTRTRGERGGRGGESVEEIELRDRRR
jgi:dephospho-CoA kinase